MKIFSNLIKQNIELEGILADLVRIRETSPTVNCVFQSTGSSWLGVNIAGRSMFPYSTIEIPQYYSSQLLSDKEIESICHKIVELKFTHFVFHGYAPYMSKIVLSLKRNNDHLVVLLVHHGFISELSENILQINSVRDFIALCKQGSIDKIGVVKAGHELLFSNYFGVNTVLLYNKVPIFPLKSKKPLQKRVNIGVLVNETFRKNMHAQVMAALLLDNTVVHVLDKTELSYLNAEDRIIEHKMLPHKQFMALLASMDINLHVTFSESFGGQVFTESLGCGVPCLTGYSNGFLNFDPELKLLLSVSEADDPISIHKSMVKVLNVKDDLSSRLVEYCMAMNKRADECISKFINEQNC